MTNKAEVRKDDVGTILRLTIKDEDGVVVDVSTATLKMIFEKPSGTITEKTAVLTGDGTDGQVQYVVENGFLDEIGIWKRQGEAVIGSNQWKTSIVEFRVAENLEE